MHIVVFHKCAHKKHSLQVGNTFSRIFFKNPCIHLWQDLQSLVGFETYQYSLTFSTSEQNDMFCRISKLIFFFSILYWCLLYTIFNYNHLRPQHIQYIDMLVQQLQYVQQFVFFIYIISIYFWPFIHFSIYITCKILNPEIPSKTLIRLRIKELGMMGYGNQYIQQDEVW